MDWSRDQSHVCIIDDIFYEQVYGLELNRHKRASCFSEQEDFDLLFDGNVRWARQTCSIVSSGVSPELLLHLQVSQLDLSIRVWWWLRHRALPRVGWGFCLDLISVALLHESVMIQPRYRVNRAQAPAYLIKYSLIQSQTIRILHFFCEFLMNFFRISRQFPENSDVCRFFNQICENKSEICRKF